MTKVHLRHLALLLTPMALLSCSHKPVSPTSVQQIAPDIKASALFDGRNRAPYAALDFPKMANASSATFLNEREYVLGITADGESRAYPTRFLKFHHVINDAVGKTPGKQLPVAITYCVVCNAGVRYDPVVQGKRLYFDFYGIYNGIAALCERQSKGVFLLAEGRIVTGPMTGTHLKTGPLLDTTWGQWKRLHPDTLVMSAETPFKKWYGSAQDPIVRSMTAFPMQFFAPTVTRGDTRLAPFDMVLGVTLPPNTPSQRPVYRAYPFHALQKAGGVLNDIVGNKLVGVLMDTKTLTVTAFSRQLETQTLTFEARKNGAEGIAFYDRQTGTRWNQEGQGEDGPLQGKQLERLDSHLSQWYGWVASFPDTSIYGRNDPPHPIYPPANTKFP